MVKKSTNSSQVAEPDAGVEAALSTIAKILALASVRNEKREDQVAFLHAVGYSPTTIASFLDVPANTVSVILYQRKKKQTAGKRAKK